MQVAKKIRHCKTSFYQFISPNTMILHCLLMQQQQAHLEEVNSLAFMQQDSLAIEGRPLASKTHRHTFCSCDHDLDPMTLIYDWIFEKSTCTLKMNFLVPCFQT